MSDYLVVKSQRTGENLIIRRYWLQNVIKGGKISKEETYEAFIGDDLSKNQQFNKENDKVLEPVKILRNFSKNIISVIVRFQ